MFCGAAHLLVFIMYLFTTIMFLLNMADKEPTIILAFEVISNVSAVISTVIIMNIVWRRQDDFLQIIELTRLKMGEAERKKIGFTVRCILIKS